MVPPSIVKFQVEFVSHDVPDDPRVAQLSGWCVRFNETGLTPIHAEGRSLGNLSFRLRLGEPAFVITASTLPSKQSMSPSDFVTVFDSDLERAVVRAAGVRDPSSESRMHFEIYKRRPDVTAIFHRRPVYRRVAEPRNLIPGALNTQPLCRVQSHACDIVTFEQAI